MVLQELGFQAGQHEVLSEMLTIKLQQEVQMKAKEIEKFTKKNLKDAKIISEDLNSMYKDVEKTKNKYKKSFLDLEDAKLKWEVHNAKNSWPKLVLFHDLRNGNKTMTIVHKEQENVPYKYKTFLSRN